MRSPVVAMLWENWRLTRLEALNRLVLTLVGGAVLLMAAAPDVAGLPYSRGNATTVFVVGTFIHVCLWFSIAKLNGGKFLDGYHPGFPFPSLYTQPLRTATLVGVPVAYCAVAAAGTYVVWALLMRGAFDLPLPVVPVAAWIATLVLVQAAGYWSTRSKIVQWAGTTLAFIVCILLAGRHLAGMGPNGESPFAPERWAALFDYSLVDYTIMAVIGLVSYGLLVAGVARQRRGDSGAMRPRTAELTALRDWSGRIFPFPCPTSSTLRAQVWFELRSSGLAILVFGFMSALAIPLLFAAGIPAAFMRSLALSTLVFGPLLVLLFGSNAFGIRRRQGRIYASVFEATLGCTTVSLAARKVLVRSVCVFAALCIVAASLWWSLPMVGAWQGAEAEAQRFANLRAAAAAELAAATWTQIAALAILAFGAVALIVTARAVLEALLARYRKQLLVAGAGVAMYGGAFVVRQLMPDHAEGVAATALDALFGATIWIVMTAAALATVWLFRDALRAAVLTPRQAGVAALFSAVVAAAWLTAIAAGGVPLGAVPAADMLPLMSPALLPLLASVLAPWALSRVRHT